MLLTKEFLRKNQKRIQKLEPFLKVRSLHCKCVHLIKKWPSSSGTNNSYIYMYILSLIQFSDPDYLAFIESLKEASEPPPSIETHLEEIEAKKCKI